MLTQKRNSIFLLCEGTEGILRAVQWMMEYLPNMTPESASESAAVDKMGSLFFAWGKMPILETTLHQFPTVTGEQSAPQLRRIKIQSSKLRREAQRTTIREKPPTCARSAGE
jgi:hypothetical protein